MPPGPQLHGRGVQRVLKCPPRAAPACPSRGGWGISPIALQWKGGLWRCCLELLPVLRSTGCGRLRREGLLCLQCRCVNSGHSTPTRQESGCFTSTPTCTGPLVFPCGTCLCRVWTSWTAVCFPDNYYWLDHQSWACHWCHLIKRPVLHLLPALLCLLRRHGDTGPHRVALVPRPP